MINPLKEAMEERTAYREKWRRLNTQAFKDAGLSFESTQYGECLLLREVPGLSVNCYVSDKRFYHLESGKHIRGSVDVFIPWYEQMKKQMS